MHLVSFLISFFRWFIPYLKIGHCPVRFNSYAVKSGVNNPKTWNRTGNVEGTHFLGNVFCWQLCLPPLSYLCSTACSQPYRRAGEQLWQTVWARPGATEVCSWSGSHGMEMVNTCSTSWATETRHQINILLFLQQKHHLSSPVFFILPSNRNSAVMLQKDYYSVFFLGY